MSYKPPSLRQKKRLSKFLSADERVMVVTPISDRYFWLSMLALLPLSMIIIGLPKLSRLIKLRESNTYVLTNKRFLIIRGIFSRKVITAPLAAITHVTVEQSILQRYLFRSGHLVIITAGFDQREIVIEHIATPLRFKILIEELTDKLSEDDLEINIRPLKP